MYADKLCSNRDWKFARFTEAPDALTYNDTLKPWILPSANDFIIDGTKYEQPNGSAPGSDVEYTQASFDDAAWESVNLPHDWAIKGRKPHREIASLFIASADPF